jgi:hypothetical protein
VFGHLKVSPYFHTNGGRLTDVKEKKQSQITKNDCLLFEKLSYSQKWLNRGGYMNSSTAVNLRASTVYYTLN